MLINPLKAKIKNPIILLISFFIIGILILSGSNVYANNNEEISTLNIITRNVDNTVGLENAKYIVKLITKDSNGNEIEEDAKDVEGNYVGIEESIDGVSYRVVTSDKNGEVKLNLPIGKYRVTELKAPDGYKLNETNTYDVEIKSNGTYPVFYANEEWNTRKINRDFYVRDIKETSAEEYIALAIVSETYKIPAEETEKNIEQELQTGFYFLRYNSENKIKETVFIKNSDSLIEAVNYYNVEIIDETDSNYILSIGGVLFYFDKEGNFEAVLNLQISSNYTVKNGVVVAYSELNGAVTIPPEYTTKNEEIAIGKENEDTNVIIQISNKGKVDWVVELGTLYDAKVISNIKEYNEQNIFSMYFNEAITVDAKYTANNTEKEIVEGEYIITINKDGKIENIKEENYYTEDMWDYLGLNAKIITLDGGKIVSVECHSNYTIPKENTVDGKDIRLERGYYLLKYNNEEKIEWSIPIGVIYEECITEVNNGYFVFGMWTDISINGEYTANGKPIEFEKVNNVTVNAGMFKIDKSGKIKYIIPLELTNYQYDWYYGVFPSKIIELENNKYVFLKYSEYVGSLVPSAAGINFTDLNSSSNMVRNKPGLPEELYFSELSKYVEVDEEKNIIESQTINVTNNMEESLQIIKKDSKTAELLPGAKFTIKKIIENSDGTVTKEDAKDSEGNLIGELENINDEELRVVTTNENGEINAKLPIGKYEIIEVQAPTGYFLKDSIEENTYEVEVKEKVEEKKEWKESWNRLIGSYYNVIVANLYPSEKIENSKILSKDDTGIVIYARLNNLNIPAEDTVNNVAINKTNPVIIKYNLDNKVEWVRDTIEISYVDKVDDGYIIYGEGAGKIGADSTINNEELYINDRTIIKLNSDFIITSILNLNNEHKLMDEVYEVEMYSDTIIPAISMVDNTERICEYGKYAVTINKDLKIENIVGPYDEIFDTNENYLLLEKSVNKVTNIITKDGIQKELLPDKIYIMKCNYQGEILNIFGGLDKVYEAIKDTDGYLIKVYNENNTIINAEDTIDNEEKTLKNYMYIKLDNNLKLVNNTKDLWENRSSYERYIEYVDTLEDGYLLRVFSTKNNEFTSDETTNGEIELKNQNYAVIKTDKSLKVDRIMYEYYNTITYNETNEFVLPSLTKLEKGIYKMVNRYFTSNITIPEEDTVDNKKIYIEAGYHSVLFNKEFKVIDIDFSNSLDFVTENGYISDEYFSEDKVISPEDTVDNKEIIIQGGSNSLILYDKQMKVKKILTGYEIDGAEYNQDLNEYVIYIGNAYNDEEINILPEDMDNGEGITLKPYSNYLLTFDINTLKIKKVIYGIEEYSNPYTKLEDGIIYVLGLNSDIPAEYTESGKDIKLDRYSYNSYYFVKYNKDYKIQYAVPADEFIYQKATEKGYEVLTKTLGIYTLTIMDKEWNILRTIDNYLLTASDGGYIYNEEVLANTTIPKEYNTLGEDLFIEKGKYIVKETADEKIDWLIETENYLTEMEETTNGYFGIWSNGMNKIEKEGGPDYKVEIGCLKITEELIKEQLLNKTTLNISNEPSVGKVIVKYLDRNTNKEIAKTEEFEDKIGVEYSTESKDIQYYNLVDTPENASGTVKDGVTEIIYYYDRQDFNIKTEKTISELYINGEKQNIKNSPNNLFQVSIHRKELDNTSIQIKYIIKIENTGEIPGTAGIVTDEIPEGLEFFKEDNKDYWKLENGKAVTDILDGEIIQPGESKELEIVLRCVNTGNNIGLKNNRAVASNMKNQPNFEDSDRTNDTDECKLLITVGTGGENIIKIELIMLAIGSVIAAIISLIKKKIKK